jgi:hypothetical protein
MRPMHLGNNTGYLTTIASTTTPPATFTVTELPADANCPCVCPHPHSVGRAKNDLQYFFEDFIKKILFVFTLYLIFAIICFTSFIHLNWISFVGERRIHILNCEQKSFPT